MANHRLTTTQADIFARVVGAGAQGYPMVPHYVPAKKLVEFGLIEKKPGSRHGLDPYVAVDPGPQLKRFMNESIVNEAHKRFLLAWAYIEVYGAFWSLTELGQAEAKKRGFL